MCRHNLFVVVIERAGNALRAAGRKPVMNVTDRDAAKKAAREAEELAKKM